MAFDEEMGVDPENPGEDTPVPFGLMVDMAVPEVNFENLTEGYDPLYRNRQLYALSIQENRREP